MTIIAIIASESLLLFSVRLCVLCDSVLELLFLLLLLSASIGFYLLLSAVQIFAFAFP